MSGYPLVAKNVSVTRADLLQECKNTEFLYGSGELQGLMKAFVRRAYESVQVEIDHRLCYIRPLIPIPALCTTVGEWISERTVFLNTSSLMTGANNCTHNFLSTDKIQGFLARVFVGLLYVLSECQWIFRPFLSKMTKVTILRNQHLTK